MRLWHVGALAAFAVLLFVPNAAADEPVPGTPDAQTCEPVIITHTFDPSRIPPGFGVDVVIRWECIFP